ncbi:MAG TPA: transglutaminase family protein [Gemmataceae bacterium]|nr:transglutaminase family protein [Gemmataceae bacterium]
MLRRSAFVLTLLAFYAPLIALADPPEEFSVEQLAERGRKSVVVITSGGRDGKQRGIGTGFVISKDGLIATNLHVIGEGRPISVELSDGSKHDVTTVHATDRAGDLAIVRIEAKDLMPLELGDSDKAKDGQPVVALGNPQGLKHSVVSGVVSSRRVLDGRSMIQLAIPLEPGNSGGPVLDRQGRVQGIVTMKSAVTENLGFAIPINALKPLLQKPNPIVMEKWLTIGALDADEWTPLFGAHWRQRAGRIQVDGLGKGFGGRSLCLSHKAVPEVPFEIAVTVKLGDESGAAGLVFHSDGNEKHYGFYPSNGEMRLSRFDGPDVYSWKVMVQKPSEFYRPGEWNTLKVRIEKDKFLCYVNGHLAIEASDDTYAKGQVGLAKFRETVADFKNFQVGNSIRPEITNEAANLLEKAIEGLSPAKPLPGALERSLLAQATPSLAMLRDRARQLEKQAAHLRELALDVHQKRVRSELVTCLNGDDSKVDLVQAALLVAWLDNDELDINGYREEFDRMARKLVQTAGKEADVAKKLTTLNRFFFEDRGFHGSRIEYYNRSNSYLNEVIDDREGLPITLSVLYIELGRRAGLKLEGVGLPGHFIVRHIPAKGEPQLIDVYEGGKVLSLEAAKRKVADITGGEWKDEYLKPVAKRAIVVRVLHNLLNLTREGPDLENALRYLDAIIDIQPEAGGERMMRAAANIHFGKRALAREDVNWLTEHHPADVPPEQLRRLQKYLEEGER